MRCILAFWIVGFLALGAVAQPWQPRILWQREGRGDSCEYGYTILPLGDQNNDGYGDWAVFAIGSATPRDDDSGYVEFFHGGNPPSTVPYMTIHQSPAARYLSDARAWGDLNGDGYVDWVVESTLLSSPSTNVLSFYFGGPTADTLADTTLNIPIGTWYGPVSDFNGDGYDDFFVYYYRALDSTQIYYGGNPIHLTPGWVWRRPAGDDTTEAYPWGVGDFNGDGRSDFLSWMTTTNPTRYHTSVFLGGMHPDTLPTYTWSSDTCDLRGAVKDLNGDGHDEMVFEGAAGTIICFGRDSLRLVADAILPSPCEGNITSVVSLGDVNHDGYQDFGVVYEYCDNAWWGMFVLYLGGPTLNPQPAWVLEGNTPPLYLPGIAGAAGLGDINGDGIDDFAVSCIADNLTGGLRGKVVIFAGDSNLGVSADPHVVLPTNFTVSVYPNPFNSLATIELTLPAYMRDVRLTVYNILGQAVREIPLQPTGLQLRYAFHAEDLASGLYLLRAQAGQYRATRKLLLLR